MSDSTTPVRVRFAPSPTGKLHVGGARTAIFNWAFARANNGTFILRIDDTDPTRSTDENTQVILRAMRWMGLDWDEGPEVGGDFGPYAQTERLEMYKAAAQKLWDEGRAYPCFCTTEQLAEDRKAAQERKDPFQGYQRRCRNLDPAEAKARIEAGEPYVLRIKVPEDRGDVVIHDAVHGDVTFDAKELDDFVIFRSDGTPTYNFASVVRPRTKHLGDVAGICSMVFDSAETLPYEEKAVSKGLAKEGMATILDAAIKTLEGVSEESWNAEAVDAALEQLPDQLDAKKRIVFQAIRAAICGNLVSPPLGVVIELVGKADALARLERAKGMAL